MYCAGFDKHQAIVLATIVCKTLLYCSHGPLISATRNVSQDDPIMDPLSFRAVRILYALFVPLNVSTGGCRRVAVARRRLRHASIEASSRGMVVCERVDRASL